MMFCCCNKSSSAANLSRYAKGMVRGDVTQNGLALADKWMWNCSPSIALMMPSNTIGNSVTIEFLVSNEVVVFTDVALMDGRSKA